MSPETILELVGYFSSLLVLISLLMSSVVKLRIINTIGNIIYTGYALAIGSYPTAVMGASLVIINVYFLIKLKRNKDILTVQTAQVSENGLRHFLRHYRNDIQENFPLYDFQLDENEIAYVVYAGANPVGVLIGCKEEDATIRISLDYTAPSHRDCSVGKFLYQELKDAGVKRLVTGRGTGKHEQYLTKMHFTEENGEFVKVL